MKSLVLYSGGLDSRLAIKLEQEKGNEVTIFHIKLPFVAGKLDEKFLDKQNVNKVILDATKEPLFSSFLVAWHESKKPELNDPYLVDIETSKDPRHAKLKVARDGNPDFSIVGD